VAKNRNEGRLDTVVGPETNVRGDFRITGGMRLDGQIEGRVDITETLVTGQRSLLKGEVRCREAVIAGRIEGDVFATETVELQTGAQVFGNISSKGLVIQPDCLFQGNCSMVQSDDAGT
jgi:cytoskeletal protein CcmA (bactofilin family)